MDVQFLSEPRRAARERGACVRGRVTTATPEQAQGRSGERVGQGPKGWSVCDDQRVSVPVNDRLLLQSRGRVVGFGWQSVTRAAYTS